MKNILHDLYEGKIRPEEQCVPQSSYYHELNHQVSDAMLQWKQRLSTEEFDQLQELLDLRRESDALQSQEAFTFGFKLGALVMIDVLQAPPSEGQERQANSSA